jgi:DNA-directed DNA polymerase|nr:MAG TPA: DNA POLYMERASE [Caudoviricetes sp.]
MNNPPPLTEVIQLFQERFDKDKTLGMLLKGKGSFINCYNSFTHRLHGRCDTLGANSGRFTHSKPNVSQAPRDPEFRKLISVPSDKLFVDVDAEALELCILGHYLAPYDGGHFAEAVYSGDKAIGTDIHTINMKRIGTPNRDVTKTVTYAMCYGAGKAKIGYGVWDRTPFDYTQLEYDVAKENILNRCIYTEGEYLFPLAKSTYIPMTEDLVLSSIYGSKIVDNFKNNIPGYNDLIVDTERRIIDSRLQALDGRWLFIRAIHKALNSLLQGGGAISMKYVSREAFKQLSKKFVYGRDFAKILDIHDALNYEIIPQIKDEVNEILIQAFKTASDQLNLARPIKGAPAFGHNQQETH